jgi:non-ribosomal peptide synthetase component F
VAIEVPPNRIRTGCTSITPDLLPLVTLAQPEIDGIVASVAGGSRNVQDIYPLAPLQEGILFHSLMASGGDPFLGSALLEFESRERLDGFLAALQSVIDRHDVLRTAILWDGLPESVQVVWRKAMLPVEEIVPAGDDPARELWDRVQRRQDRIDIRRAPLMRAEVARDVARNQWLLMLRFHHVAIDHTTLELIIAEVRAYLARGAPELPEPPPFRGFVAEARLGMRREDHQVFFREMLGDIDEPTAPFGLHDVRRDGSGIGEARLPLEPDLARRLRAQARRLEVTPASIFHLAWALVLARTTGRDDVVFGTVLFGRMHGLAGVDRALGLFINTLPLRLSLDGRSVEHAARDSHTRIAELLRHEHASLLLAQGCSALPPTVPLFSALLNYRYTRSANAFATGASFLIPGVRLLHADERTNYPFALSVDDYGMGFSLVAQVPDRIGPARVCRFMQTALEKLISALETAPGTQSRHLEVLPAFERQQVIQEWNPTATLPLPATLPSLFEAQVARAPDAVALVNGDAQLSYCELNRRANRLAHGLIRRGVGPEQLVGLCVGRTPGMIVGLLAILKAGGAYLPLDLAYPAARLALMLDEAQPMLILTDAETAPRLPTSAPHLAIDAAGDAGDGDTNPTDTERLGPLMVGHPAYVIYTSGSTGRPKGVVVTHTGVAALAAAQVGQLDVTATSRVLQFASLNFDASLWEIAMALTSGAALVLTPPEAHSGPPLRALLAGERVTHATLPPAVLATLGEADLPLDCLVVAGEKCPAPLVAEWSTKRLMVNAYGPTESTVCATISSRLDRTYVRF